jgi:hypothetical protein
MNPVTQERIKKRLKWVDSARGGITRACGDTVNPRFDIFPTVDPLRFILKIALRHPLGKSTRKPLRAYLRYWAEDNGCDIPRIRINDRYIQAEILTDGRVWRRDPFGRFKKKPKRFEKIHPTSRDKDPERR